LRRDMVKSMIRTCEDDEKRAKLYYGLYTEN
jgi:hypothetical protein